MFALSIWVLRGIIAVILISLVASTAGTFTVFKGATFFVSGIAHAVLAGAAFGIFITLYFFPFPEFLMTIFFAIFFALAIGYATHRSENVDVSVGIMFAFSMSLAVLFLAMIKEYASVAWGLIIGDLLLLSQEDVLWMSIAVLLILLLFLIFRRKMLFSIFDPEGAEAMGVNPYLYETLLYLLVGIGVVVIMKGVGAILVYALLIIPAAAGKRLSKGVLATGLFALLFSLLSGFGGIALSVLSGITPSALAGLIATFIYFLSYLKRGTVKVP